MKLWHRWVLRHRQSVRQSKLIDYRDYCFCSCGAVFYAV